MDLTVAESVLAATATTTLTSLRRAFLEAAVRYSQARAAWALAEPGERASMDESRTAAHDALIDACNILSRGMRDRGEGNEWRRVLGEDRREIGDFACYVHCPLGVGAR